MVHNTNKPKHKLQAINYALFGVTLGSFDRISGLTPVYNTAEWGNRPPRKHREYFAIIAAEYAGETRLIIPWLPQP